MVFHSASESESETVKPPSLPPSMASVFSAKSQPLHNFPHSNLQWPMNQSNHHHHRSSHKHGDSGHSTDQLRPSFVIKLPYNANPSGSVNHGSGNDKATGGGGKRAFPVFSGAKCVMEKKKKKKKEKKLVAVMNSLKTSLKSSGNRLMGYNGIRDEKNEEKMKLEGSDEGKPKILIRIPARNKGALQEHQRAGDAVEEEPVVARTWNLRPRRAVAKPQNVNGGVPQAQSQPEMAALVEK